ncbi:MAG: glycosyltransferase [Firmicutes bacterium]|nr:glycosyltransferase [Bacillota bacterium]
MIVKNEENNLARCLNSCKDFVDEIIIVDTGSTDETKNIARDFTDKIFDFVWSDDFSKARNFSISKATSDYIFWLDADDIIENHDLRKLLKLKEKLTEKIDMVYLKYHTRFDSIGNPTFSYYRERIIKNCKNAKFIEPIHECIEPFGIILHSDAAITHSKKEDRKKSNHLEIFENYKKSMGYLTPRLQFFYARELMHSKKYKASIKVFRDFLNEPRGWIEHKLVACLDMSSCYKKLFDDVNALASLLHSFTLAAPKAETLCRIAHHFYDSHDFVAAIFWYESALKCDTKNHSLFVKKEYECYIPSIQLAQIYKKLKKYDKAKYYNSLAEKYRPNDKAVQYNKKLFDKE